MSSSCDGCCDIGRPLRQEWETTEKPFTDPRPEAIASFHERKLEARQHWGEHLRSCPVCRRASEWGIIGGRITTKRILAWIVAAIASPAEEGKDPEAAMPLPRGE
jgi:hypothetical protein